MKGAGLRSLATDLIANSPCARARRGQAMIMLALMLVPIVGMLGLAVDGGVYLYARRTAQAAADAAALAGARQLSKGNAAQDDVVAVAAANGQGDITPAVQDCHYVDDGNGQVGSGTTCGTPPSGASGVFVRTEETVPTFFLRVIPGAPASTVATASAIARVQLVTGLKAGAPFIVCGYGSWDVTDDPTTTNGGTTTSILTQDNPLTINPAAIGRTFRIWDSRLAQEGAGCGAGSRFKGLANSGENRTRTLPGWLKYTTGTVAGPTQDAVAGPGGCPAGDDFNGCMLILPLVTDSPPSGGSGTDIYGVGFAAFRMSRVDANSYNGTLLDAYIIGAGGTNGWNGQDGRLVSIRLAG